MSSTVYSGTLVMQTLSHLAIAEALAHFLGQRQSLAKKATDVFSLILFMTAVLLSERDDAAELLFALALALHLVKPVVVANLAATSMGGEVVEHAVGALILMSTLYVTYNVALESAAVGEVVLLYFSAVAKLWSLWVA